MLQRVKSLRRHRICLRGPRQIRRREAEDGGEEEDAAGYDNSSSDDDDDDDDDDNNEDDDDEKGKEEEWQNERATREKIPRKRKRRADCSALKKYLELYNHTAIMCVKKTTSQCHREMSCGRT